MSYIQGFLVPVPTHRKDDYIQMAKEAAPFFEKFGATRMMECWGDEVPEGKVTDFRRAVDLKEGETVVFSWIEWPDKASCDKATEAMENDPDMKAPDDIPMDMKRMIWGGFQPVFSFGGQD